MKNILLTIPLFLLINGCSLLYSYDENLTQRIDQWIEEGKFKTALNTISYVDPDHKHYKTVQQQKKKITLYLINYESDAIIKSNQLVKQGNWLTALDYIDQVSENIPDNRKIISHKKNLLKQRDQIIKKYETRILNHQANNLVAKIGLYDEINKTVTTDEKNQLEIKEFYILKNKVIKRLTLQSEYYYRKNDFDKAENSVALGLKLRPEKEYFSRLNKIKKHIQSKNNIKNTLRINHAKALLKKLSQGYSRSILKETKETINQLKENTKKTKTELNLIAKLEKHLKIGVKRYFKAARKLYSEEKIQEALSIWLSLKDLEPDYPKLDTYIKRAERIVKNLNKITNK